MFVVGVLGGEEGLEAGGPDEAVENAVFFIDRDRVLERLGGPRDAPRSQYLMLK